MSRFLTVTEKIPRETTGLAGSLFVHVDHVGGQIISVRFSIKWKDDSTMDAMLTALGDAVTDIAQDLMGS